MREFRIVVVVHGDLAMALVGAATLICGQLDDVHAVGLFPDDAPETLSDRLLSVVGDSDDAVLVLADLAGGTPHNVALVAMRRLPRARLISGVNLAVLLEAAMGAGVLDDALVERLVTGGRAALVDAGRLLATKA